MSVRVNPLIFGLDSVGFSPTKLLQLRINPLDTRICSNAKQDGALHAR